MSPTYRFPWVRALLLAGVLIGLLVLLHLCTRPARDAARKAEAGATSADARTSAAKDASQIRDGNDAARETIRNQVEEAQDDIRRETDPAARDRRARQRLCELDPGACPR